MDRQAAPIGGYNLRTCDLMSKRREQSRRLYRLVIDALMMTNHWRETMDFKEAAELIEGVMSITTTKALASMKFSEKKFGEFLAVLSSTTYNDKEVEKARQECLDAFSAMLDVRIEGCKKLDDLSRKITGV